MNPNFGGRGRFRRRAVRLEARRLAYDLEQLTSALALLSGSFESSTPLAAKADYLRALDAQQRGHAALVAAESEAAPDFGAVREAIADRRRDLEAVRARLAVQADTRPYHPRD